jgi:hypothetical protein
MFVTNCSVMRKRPLPPDTDCGPPGWQGHTQHSNARAKASAALRDQLVVELQAIASEHDATAWAQRILGAKNRLVAADARQVEDVFAAKLASFAPATATGDAPAGTSPSELVTSVDRWAPEAPEMPSRGQEVDKSHLAHPEPRRVRDKEHVRFVAKQPCLVCGRRPSDAHHLRFAQHRALGRKVSNEFTVPLCRGHHREVHRSGDEAVWWSKAGIDPLGAARTLWTQTHPLRSDRLLKPQTLINRRPRE